MSGNKIPFFVRLPAKTVLEIKRRAKRHGVSEAAVVEDAVMPVPNKKPTAGSIVIDGMIICGGPRRKARGGK